MTRTQSPLIEMWARKTKSLLITSGEVSNCRPQCRSSVDSQTIEKKDCLIAGSAKQQSEKTKCQKSFIKHFLIEKKCCQRLQLIEGLRKNCSMGGIKN